MMTLLSSVSNKIIAALGIALLFVIGLWAAKREGKKEGKAEARAEGMENALKRVGETMKNRSSKKLHDESDRRFGKK